MKKVSDEIGKQWQEYYEKEREHLATYPPIQAFIKAHEAELADDVITRSFSQLLEFERENEYYQQHGSAEKMPGYRPHLVVDGKYISVMYRPTAAEQQRLAQQTIDNRVTYIAVPKAVRKASFNEMKTDGRTEVITRLGQFVQAYLENPTAFHKGIYLWGNFGRGKTYLMGALANKLAENGYKTVFINLPTFISELKESFSDHHLGKSAAEQIDEVKKAPILILDDLGTESMSDWVRDDVMSVILQYRMQEELPTFFTSNLSMKQYREHLAETKQSTDGLKADRIMERIYYLADEILIQGDNLRR